MTDTACWLITPSWWLLFSWSQKFHVICFLLLYPGEASAYMQQYWCPLYRQQNRGKKMGRWLSPHIQRGRSGVPQSEGVLTLCSINPQCLGLCFLWYQWGAIESLIFYYKHYRKLLIACTLNSCVLLLLFWSFFMPSKTVGGGGTGMGTRKPGFFPDMASAKLRAEESLSLSLLSPHLWRGLIKVPSFPECHIYKERACLLWGVFQYLSDSGSVQIKWFNADIFA